MSIKIDLSSISKEGNKVFGNVYFENENIMFPEKQWNDFVIIIVNWWASSLSKLICNETISANLLFMDGPFSIKINYLDDKMLKLYFTNGDSIIANTEVSILHFVKGFLKEVNSLIRYVSSKDWNDEEIDLLKKNYKSLNNNFKKFEKCLQSGCNQKPKTMITKNSNTVSNK